MHGLASVANIDWAKPLPHLLHQNDYLIFFISSFYNWRWELRLIAEAGNSPEQLQKKKMRHVSNDPPNNSPSPWHEPCEMMPLEWCYASETTASTLFKCNSFSNGNLGNSVFYCCYLVMLFLSFFKQRWKIYCISQKSVCPIHCNWKMCWNQNAIPASLHLCQTMSNCLCCFLTVSLTLGK